MIVIMIMALKNLTIVWNDDYVYNSNYDNDSIHQQSKNWNHLEKKNFGQTNSVNYIILEGNIYV